MGRRNKAKLKSDRFRFVCVLSDEESEGYEHGFVSAEILKKYAPDGEFTAMMCGPQAMYDFVGGALAELGGAGRNIRREANCIGNRDVPPATYRLTVEIRGEKHEIEAKAEETVLSAMERAGLNVPSKCRAGGCGFCHTTTRSKHN